VPKVDDISQGSVGNCYFLSALASLAEYPSLIRRLFNTDEVSKTGMYAVNLYINGEFKMVEIDDFFPCTEVEPGKFESAFSRPYKNRVLWVLILEKAWAKVNGSYDLSDGGYTSHAISCLTGAP
jgi:calpain-15